MKIILANGTELEPIVVTGGPRTVQGARRDVLTFVFPVSAGLVELDSLFTPANCERITITDDEGNEAIHKAYTIRAEIQKTNMEVEPATEETDAVYEDRIMVSMGQRTYTESQLAAQGELFNILLGVSE